MSIEREDNQYWRHNWLTPKAEVRQSSIGGKGVFAKEAIGKDEIIAVWGGYIITRRELSDLVKKYGQDFRYPVQLVDGFWIGPRSEN